MFSERLFSRWRRAEQSELEKLRNVFGTDRLLLESAARSFQVSQDSYQQKRLIAVERIWAAVIRLRQDFSRPVFFFSILIPSEYAKQLDNREMLGASMETVTPESISDVMKWTQELESDRPFLGETLWIQFFAYRAFMGRIAFLIIDKKRQRKVSDDWRSDNGLRQILSWVLPSKEVTSLLDGKEVLGDVNRAINALEGQMLREISMITSGKRSSLESFENAKSLKDAIASINPGSTTSQQ